MSARNRREPTPARRRPICRDNFLCARTSAADSPGSPVRGLLWDKAGAVVDVVILGGGLPIVHEVKRIIQLFMNGGASQCDTFDYKPELIKHGQKFDPGSHVEAATSVPGSVLKSPWSWKQYGETGRWVSSVFPHVATIVDDLTFLMSMASKTNVHGPGSYMQNTGFVTPGFPVHGRSGSPRMDSGTLNENLPTFVVMPDPRGLPYNNTGNFTSAFLPSPTREPLSSPTTPVPITDLFPPDSAKFITHFSSRTAWRCSTG